MVSALLTPARSDCHRGDFAGPQNFSPRYCCLGSPLEEFSGLHRHGFDVAVGARLTVDPDFELRAPAVRREAEEEWTR
jgi:hypothetical protein